MPQDISGRIVLITGASSGIGAACARSFGEHGCHLVLIARRAERLNELAKEILEASLKRKIKVHCMTKDMSDIAAVAATPSELPEEFRAVDILVNNAGLALGTSAGHDVDMQDAQMMIQTNVMGVIAMTRAIVPGMVDRKRGHVINMSSIAGHEAYSGGAIYSASKHAVDAFTSSLRHDLVATPVRVTAISPGAVQTEFSLVRFSGDAAKAEAVYAGIEPLTATDIAEDVLYAATRPAHVQCAEIVTFATLQSSAKGLARVLPH